MLQVSWKDEAHVSLFRRFDALEKILPGYFGKILDQFQISLQWKGESLVPPQDSPHVRALEADLEVDIVTLQFQFLLPWRRSLIPGKPPPIQDQYQKYQRGTISFTALPQPSSALEFAIQLKVDPPKSYSISV
jgi:hypothetical protein